MSDQPSPSSPSSPDNLGPSGELDAVVIHKDGSKEPVKPTSALVKFLGWLFK
jgi:hypothetical protein